MLYHTWSMEVARLLASIVIHTHWRWLIAILKAHLMLNRDIIHVHMCVDNTILFGTKGDHRCKAKLPLIIIVEKKLDYRIVTYSSIILSLQRPNKFHNKVASVVFSVVATCSISSLMIDPNCESFLVNLRGSSVISALALLGWRLRAL